MIILGIDPGTTAIGYALVKNERSPYLVSAGFIGIKEKETSRRLGELNRKLNEILAGQKPDAVAVEKIFFAKNIKTAGAVAEARGSILLTTVLAGIKVYEYTPLEVKKTVTGDGRADKEQIKKMVRLILPETKNLRARDDVFDAIAIALCGCFKINFYNKVEE